MHRCLQIQEIRSQICGYLGSPNKNPSSPFLVSRCTLASLARTCRTFHEPALNELWYFQCSLLPLILCLPPDAYQIDDKAKVLFLTRNLCPEDYKRIKYYASRIRILNTETFRGRQLVLHDLVLPFLLSRNPDKTPILFNMRHLTMSLVLFKGPAILPRLAIGPALQTVEIKTRSYHFEEPTNDIVPWKNLFTVLKICQQSLQSLGLEGPHGLGDSPSKEYTLMPFLSGFTCLKTLRIDPFFYSVDEFRQLAIMNTLRHLSINLDHTIKIAKLDDHEHSGGFPHLQKLEFTVTDIKSAIWLLSRKGFAQLEYLHVKQINHKVWDLPRFFQLLETRFLDSQLQSIRVSSKNCHCGVARDLRETPGYGYALTSHSFIPLLSLRNLIELSIEPIIFPTLDDNLLRDMADSWPCLKTLRLLDNTITSTPMLKLTSLLILTKACPLLEKLTLRIDARQCPEFSEIADVPPSNLHLLNVCTSLAENDTEIACFLTTVFPNLQCLDYSPQDESDLDAINTLSQSVWLNVLDSLYRLLPSPEY